MKTYLFPFCALPPAALGFGVKLFLIFALALLAGPVQGESVINTVHNLSANGPGTIKATSAGPSSDACVFCHTMHQTTGVTPLWNHTMSGVSNYIVYSSARFTNLNITVPQPNGSSRLCLSCHDGTVALGSVSSEVADIPLLNSVTTMPAGANNFGTDLSSDHPISFVYDSALAARDLEIKDPGTLTGKVRLDGQSRLQCTACHNPHDNQYGNFLVMDNTGAALCLACHQPSMWGASQHAVSAVAAPLAIRSKFGKKSGAGANSKVSTAVAMSAIGCENCHSNHRAGRGQHLLSSAAPEQNCFVCHSGTTAKKNIAVEFQKPSLHPITLNSAAHSVSEDPLNPVTRHVVCADCHNSHAANNNTAIVPNASGALARVTGVTQAGGVIQPLIKEYELCYRCHADSVNRGAAVISRQYPETNTRLQFNPANQSYHPVAAVGKNATSVPSLVTPWKLTSLMYCTDCHNSDSGTKAGGAGANGPHGSIYYPILERNLVLTDGQPESGSTYALCYKCHSRNVVLSNASFRFHKKHVVDMKTACTTCHDSHGVANAPHLVNFNATYVTNSSLGLIRYTSAGPLKGNCTLSCHGKDHKNTTY